MFILDTLIFTSFYTELLQEILEYYFFLKTALNKNKSIFLEFLGRDNSEAY